MAKYSDIKGFTVQTLASDTAASSIGAGSWSSSANAPYTIERSGGFGAQTAAVVAGGFSSTTDSYIQTTIEFNGSSWSSGGTMNRPAGQSTPAFGTEPSGGVAGGYKTSGNAVVNNFESYNGTAFTESTDINTARQAMGATGASSTSGIVAGGTTSVSSPPSAEGVTNVELWNGSSWTEIAEINTKRHKLTALGSTCPAPTCLVAGGEDDANFKTNVELYNGTNWTEVNEINVNRSEAGGAGSTSTDGLYFGGYNPPSATALTEHWNGTNWTEVADMSTARYAFGAGTGTSTSAIAAGGAQPGASATTESWSAPPSTGFNQITEGQLFFNSTTNTFKETIQDFPGGTFASGGNLNTARRQQGTFGAYNDAIVAGTSTYGANVENYNGTAWTEINDVPAGASSSGGSGTTASSGAIFMGYNTSTSVTNATYEFDGTNWTAGGSANTSRGAGGGTGSSADDAIYVGGTNAAAPQTIYANVETYNGSSWTETTDIAEARQLNALVGTSTSALMIGGSPAPSPTQTQSWNGTSWTNIGALPTNIYGNAGFGTSALAIACGGLPPGTDTNANMRAAMFYNGTSWSDVSEMATSRASANGAATNASATNGLVFGGYNPLNAPGYDDDANKTEEWTVDLGNKTITTS